jgi:lantibiotic biosynthesis protein
VGGAATRKFRLTASGFFVLRTPLLPFDELAAWSADLEAPRTVGDEELATAVERDRLRLRKRLAVMVERPEFRDALFVASPDIEASIDDWLRDPGSGRGRKAEQPLVAYLSRAAARATPFGLFAGCSTGTIHGRTSLVLAGREQYRRHSRLDMEYLCALAEAIQREPALRRELVYRPNSSLYEAGGRLHLVEASQAPGRRSYKLVAVDSTPYLTATLERARPGERLDVLAAALVDDEVKQAEAEEYLGELVESQILTGDVEPQITGDEPVTALVRTLSERPATAAIAQTLHAAQVELDAIDGVGLGVRRRRYEAVAATLQELPAVPQLSRLVQVDLVKPAHELLLGRRVIDEVAAGVRTLHALASAPSADSLSRFREQFVRRYETREVALVEALDEEHGIGFESAEGGSLAVDAGRERRQAMLLRKLSEALTSGSDEIVVGAAEVDALDLREPPPLPEGIEVVGAIESESTHAVDEGAFRVLVQSVSGPPGARLIARFCHADGRLAEHVREQLQAEEETRDGRVVAEIVHLPEDRVGNILSRPLLRTYEIPYLGASAAPAERQLPVSDLLVSVEQERIVVRSRRLGVEVVPRLTTAHNFGFNSLAVYRFLCTLQHQGVTAAIMWDWGTLAQAPFLPRVISGRCVLSRARWNLDEAEVATLRASGGAREYAAVQELRRTRGLPRWIALADGDNELVVDLDNVLSLESLGRELRNRTTAALVELFPGPDRLCVHGPEGRFTHQFVIPFLHESPAAPAARPRPIMRCRRRFAPGSEWLYLKLFTGAAATDLVLDRVAHGVEASLASGAVDGWFFIRYGDPDWHLRLRIQGDPERLLAETLPTLHRLAEPLLESGRLWRIELGTYDREVERYGGDRGIIVAEQLFRADSDAVLALLRALGGEDSELRARAALAGIYLLFEDFGLSLEEKRMIAKRACDGYGREFGVTKAFQNEMSSRFRRERPELERLLYGDSEMSSLLQPLRERSQKVEPLAAQLRDLDQAGELMQPLADIVMSFAHMHVNRLLRSGQRAHELVLYEMLSRIYSSEAARR